MAVVAVVFGVLVMMLIFFLIFFFLGGGGGRFVFYFGFLFVTMFLFCFFGWFNLGRLFLLFCSVCLLLLVLVRLVGLLFYFCWFVVVGGGGGGGGGSGGGAFVVVVGGGGGIANRATEISLGLYVTGVENRTWKCCLLLLLLGTVYIYAIIVNRGTGGSCWEYLLLPL